MISVISIQGTLQEVGLTDVHRSHTGMDWLPPTHKRGQTQIDFIFTSPGITIKWAGFLPFQKFPGDHRALWVDIETKDIIGYDPQPLSMASARCLKSNNPFTQKEYLQHLISHLQQEGLPDILTQSYEVPTSCWTSSHMSLYSTIENQFKEFMQQAEKQCCKFKIGSRPFSEAFNIARKWKFFWELTVKDLLSIPIPK